MRPRATRGSRAVGALFALGGVLAAVCLAVVLTRLGGSRSTALAGIVVAVAWGVGLLVGGPRRDAGPRVPGRGWTRWIGPAAWFLVPLALAGAWFGALALLPASMAVTHAALLRRLRDPLAAAVALGAGPLAANFAAVAAPGAATLVAVAVQLGVSLVLLLVLHGSLAAQAGRRAYTRRELAHAAAGLGRRLAPGFGFAATVLGLALVFQLVAAAWHAHRIERARDAAAAAEHSSGAGDAGRPGDASARAGTSAGELFPESLEIGATGALHSEKVLWLSGPDVRQRPVWRLAALCFDVFTADGMQASGLELAAPRRDTDDGLADGWVRVAEAPRELELELRQVPLAWQRTSGTPLLRPLDWTAVAAEVVVYHPRGVLSSADPVPSAVELGLRVAQAGHSARARLDDAERRFQTALPELASTRDRAALASLERRAREIAGPNASPEQAVARVLAHFARGRYAYSFEDTSLRGLAALSEFLERRTGFCTHYAAASVALLRSLGVPSRVVAGYLVDEWSDEEGAFVARGYDAHAWFEAWLEGRGWVTFDATPEELREDSDEALAAGDPEGVAGGAVQRIARAFERYAEDAGFGFAGLSLAVFGELARWLVESRVVFVLLGVLVLWLLVRGRRRGAAAPAGELARTAGSARAEPRGLLGTLLGALERIGFGLGAGETPRELAHRVGPVLDAPDDELDRGVAAGYRERFGDVEPTEEDRRSVAELASRIVRSREPTRRAR